MEDLIAIDDNYCANCGCSNTTPINCGTSNRKFYDLDIVYVNSSRINSKLNVNKSSVICDKIPVFTALKELFNFQLHGHKTTNEDPGGGTSNNNKNRNVDMDVDVSVPLCLACSILLQDLYRSFKLFQSVRDEASYISRLSKNVEQVFGVTVAVISDDHEEPASNYYPNPNPSQEMTEEMNIKPCQSPVVYESEHTTVVWDSGSANDFEGAQDSTDDNTATQVKEELIDAAILGIASEVIGPLGQTDSVVKTPLVRVTEFPKTHTRQPKPTVYDPDPISGRSGSSGTDPLCLPSNRMKQPKPNFKCKYCNYRSIKQSLVVHERMHTGEKPFACPQCNFRSRQSAHLKKHLMTHTDERPFTCKYCFIKVKYASSLKIHQKKHHPELF